MHCKDSDFACGATQYLIKELEESPHYFEAVGELEALAYQLGGTPHALRFLYALELYIYYTEEQLKYSENRICEFLQQLTQEELSSLAPCLNEFLKEVPVDESRLREDFLSCFFCNDSASQVTTLDALEIKDTEHKALLNNKLFSALMRPLTRLQPQFAYELAQVFNASENQALRQEAERILNPIQTNWRINLIPSYDDWYLCEHSEEKLMDALSEQGCMACMDAAQRPLMLLKLKGKPSALVLQTFKTADGILLPAGTWISPVTPTTRERIYTAFDTRYQKISAPLFYGTWAYMRSVTADKLEQNGALVYWI